MGNLFLVRLLLPGVGALVETLLVLLLQEVNIERGLNYGYTAKCLILQVD
jgi:hypothetical protein